MTKKILNEIDRSIQNHDRNNQHLLELVMKVIGEESKHSDGLVSLCYDIHEFDTDIAENAELAKKEGLRHPNDFVKELVNMKRKYHILWDK